MYWESILVFPPKISRITTRGLGMVVVNVCRVCNCPLSSNKGVVCLSKWCQKVTKGKKFFSVKKKTNNTFVEFKKSTNMKRRFEQIEQTRGMFVFLFTKNHFFMYFSETSTKASQNQSFLICEIKQVLRFIWNSNKRLLHLRI